MNSLDIQHSSSAVSPKNLSSSLRKSQNKPNWVTPITLFYLSLFAFTTFSLAMTAVAAFLALQIK